MFRVEITPTSRWKWLRYVAAAIAIAFVIVDPVAAAHLTHGIGTVVVAAAPRLSSFALHALRSGH